MGNGLEAMSQPQIIKFTWRIENFSCLNIVTDNELIWESPLFGPKDERTKSDWKMLLEPKPLKDDTRNMLINVQLVNNYNKKLTARCSYSILNENTDELCKQTFDYEELGNGKYFSSKGNFKLRTSNDNDNEEEFICKGNLTISCQLEIKAHLPAGELPMGKLPIQTQWGKSVIVKRVTCKFTWTIENAHRNLINAKSPLFEPRIEIPNTKWGLEVSDSANAYNITLQLHNNATENEIKVSYGYDVFTEESETMNHDSPKWHTFSKSSTTCSTPLMTKDQLSQLLVASESNTISIICYLEVPNTMITPERAIEQYGDASLQEVVLHLKELLHSNDFCDVTLYVDGQRLRAHKAIMAARSPFFRDMFLKMNDTDSSVNIFDVDHGTMSNILMYMYTGAAPLIERLARQLLVAAGKYGMMSLKRCCEDVLSREITLDNTPELLILADKEVATQLQLNIMQFIKSNHEAVIALPEFRKMHIKHPELSYSIMQMLHGN